MPTKRPQFIENEIYHITIRGVEGRSVFVDEDDNWRGIFSLYEFNTVEPVTIREKRKEREKFKQQMVRLMINQVQIDKRNKLVEILAFTFMPNHIHLLLRQLKPDGVSIFMQKFNSGYTVYFNNKHHRAGHLFQGRFASMMVCNDAYSMRLSAYIHNNPKDISGYTGHEEDYAYSSYGIYTGTREDKLDLVDTGFILGFFGRDRGIAVCRYRKYVHFMKGELLDKEVDEKIKADSSGNEYKSEKATVVRYENVEDIVKRICPEEKMIFHIRIRAKHIRECSEIRAFFAYTLRTLCNYTYKQICRYIGNMSMSGITRLVNRGFDLVCDHLKYQNMFGVLINAR